MNTESNHTRAQQLTARQFVEGISTSDQRWLQDHLRECDGCAAVAASTARALRSLNSVAIPIPYGLAQRTQFRLHLRAQQQSYQEPHRRLMWIACGVSWLFGAVTAPFVWRGLQWLGQRTALPHLVPDIGFGLWWALPAIAALAIILVETIKHETQQDWFRRQS
jgi:hypothetical protein